MADKTEAPSQRRLEEAREEGQVVRSIELNSAVILLVGAFMLRGPGKQLYQAVQTIVSQMLVSLPNVELSQKWLEQTGYSAAMQLLPPLGIFLVGMLLVGVSVTMAQTRFLWATKKIGFDFKRVNPLNGFKRIFSSRGLVELAKALLKLLVIGWVAYSFLKSNIPGMIGLSQMTFLESAGKFADLAVSLMLRVGSTYIVIAVGDYAYQRWDLMRNLRMSKEEVKEEMKRSEGDPLLKGRIRAEMRRLARSRMMSSVPKATVVVTNPTHLAIAIQYIDGMAAPIVVAKGAMHVAERIVQIAKEHNIPIVQNIPLARAIYKTVEIDQAISPDLYMAMAEVLAYVYKIRGKYTTSRQPVRS